MKKNFTSHGLICALALSRLLGKKARTQDKIAHVGLRHRYMALVFVWALTVIAKPTMAQSLNFDGSNDHVVVSGGLPVACDDFTIEAWVKPTIDGGLRAIINANNYDNGDFHWQISTTGRMGLSLPGNTPTDFNSSFTFTSGTWQHIAAVYSRFGHSLKFYRNGTLTDNFSLSVTGAISAAKPYIIGGWVAGGLQRLFKGQIDEVRMWNVARTAAEISANMACDVAQQSNLIAYYRFDHGTPGGSNAGRINAFDYSGNNMCGTLTNFALTGATSNYDAGNVSSCVAIAPIIAGSLAICNGGSSTLNSPQTGGAWSSEAPGVATVSGSGLVMSVSPGIATINYTVCGVVGSVVVSVNAIPTVGAGSGVAICSGSATTLTATGATTYSWSPSTGLSATTGASVSASPTVATTYTVTGTTSGCSNTATVSVSMTPRPIVTALSPLMGYPASSVTITGTGFNTIPANNIVYFGATRATVSSATATSLTVSVPTGATFKPATVNNNACNLTAWSPFSFLPSYDGSMYAPGAVNFAARVNLATGALPCSAVISDLDGDGKADIVLANQSSGTISVYRNISTSGSINSGSFAAQQTFATGSSPTSVAVGDMDGDGKPDIVVTNFSSTVSVLRNTSTIGTINSASFAGQVTFSCGSSPRGIALGDIDGDGKTDIVVPNSSSSTVSVLRNTSTAGTITSGSFAGSVTFAAGTNPWTVAIGDIDGDGKPDMAVTNYGASTVSVFRNTATAGTISAGSFAAQVTFAVGAECVSIAMGDLDGDGKQDLAVANYASNTISLLRNTASTGSITTGSFADQVTFSTGNPKTVAIGDINGDGKPDLVAANYNTNKASVFVNTASAGSLTSSSFAALVPFATGQGPDGLAIGDLDGDGKPEIVAPGFSGSGGVSVLRNDPLAFITGTLSTCIGSPITLNNATSGGTWVSGNTSIATVGSATGIVSGVTSGTVLITYAGTAGAAYAGNIVTAVVSINANPTVSAGSGVAICNGSSTTLTATGATTYSWSPSTGLSATTGAGVTASPGTATIYTVVGTTGSCSSSATVAVSVNPMPGVISSSAPLIVTTVAGSGSSTFSGDGGQATAAGFTITWGVRFDAAGNMYIIDGNAARIRKVNTAGIINTVAGNGTFTHSGDGGPATAAGFGAIYAMAVDADGNIYTADGSHRVRKISTNGIVNTIAGNGSAGSTGDGEAASAALLSYPQGIAVDLSGNVYVSENGTSRIRKINTAGIISTYAGGGGTSSASGVPATATYFSNAGRLACDVAGNLYIADRGHGRVCKITPANMVYTIAGISGSYGYSGDGGPATAALLNGPNDVCVGPDGSVYIAEDINHYIRKVSPSGIISTIAGNGSATYSGDNGPATSAGMWTMGIDIDASGAIYVATYSNFRIRKLAPGAICVGASTSLSNATSGGTWSSSNGNVTVGLTSGIVTGVAAGTSVVTYSLPTGCSRTITVSVNALPVVSTGASTAICAGATTALTASGAATYSWSPAAGLSASTGAGVSASPTITTTYTITGTTNGCSNTASVTVSVNALPTVSAGSGVAICYGISTTLTATGGATYSWSPTTGLSCNTCASPVANPTTTTTYTVTGTSTESCNSAAAVTVSVNPLPHAGGITGADVVIIGSTITLSESVSGGAWSASSGIATVSGGIVTGVSGGTATIRYIVSNSCGLDTASKIITVSPAGITGTLTTCAGSSTALSSTTSGGTWSSSNAAIADVNSGTGLVAGVAEGTAVISYIVSGISTTAIVTVLATPAAISGSDGVCAGTQTTFTNGGGSGIWSSSNATIATVSSAGLVSGITSGTAAITFTFSATCYIVKVITVFPSPATITGTATVCAGATTSLSSSPSGGTWSSNNLAAATVNASTGVVAGVAAGTSSVTYTSTAGCSVKRDVTVNALPATIGGMTTVCTATTSALTSSPSGGVWSSSTTYVATVGSMSGIVAANNAGTSNVTYTLPGGCAATTIVTVSTSPAAIAGALSLCAGSTTGLSSATFGGAWSTDDAGIADVVETTGVVTGTGTGTTTITYATGSCATTAVVTVSTGVTAITGTASVCAGQGTALSNATSGGTWSSGATAIATVNTSGVVTGVSAGTVLITYSISAGCYSTIVVTVNTSLSAISGTLSACPGATTALGHPISGGAWTSSNTSKATIDMTTGLVSGIAAGTTTITYAIAGCSTTATLTVYSNPATVNGTASVCEGSTTALTCSTGGGTWSSSDALVATVGTSGVVTGTGSGTATISYTLTSGCASVRVVTVSALPGSITGSLSGCIGTTNSLSSTPAGGTWTSSSTYTATVDYTTGLLTGSHAGTTNITYTAAGGCRVIQTATVGATPGSISGLSSMCNGSTLTLSSPTWSGVWSSSDGAVATVATTSITNGLASGLTAGTTTISYTVGACSATKIVTVTAGIAAITGDPVVCVGTGSPLANATTGGTWSSSATAIATVNTSGVVAGVSSGVATITYRLSTSCFTTVAATVNAAPSTITGTLSVCPGATTALGHAIAGGTWTSSNITKATIDISTGVATGVSAGTTTITYAISAGCYKTATLTVGSGPASINGTAVLCAGSTTTLTCATTGGAWSTADAAIATVTGGVVSGIAVGTTTISYITGAGCAATRVVTITTAPSAIGGTTAVCAGTTVTLTATPGGGTWSSSNTSKATIGAATGILSGIASGTANITYAITASCFSTTNVTVSTSPSGITGPDVLCSGGTITLGNGTAYGVWSSTNAGVATVGAATGVVTGTGSGTTTISYTVGSCAATKVLTVNTSGGTISGDALVCIGQTNSTLTTGLSGGTWSSSASAIASVHAANGLITGVAAGTATITYTIAPGCFISRTATVNTAVAAITGPSTVIVGNTVTLANATGGGTWSSSNTTKATIVSGTGVLTGLASGTTTITYMVSAGCYRTTGHTVTASRDMAGNSIANNLFSVNPNPSSGVLNITTSVNGVFTIYTIDGKSVEQYKISTPQATVSLPHGLASGIYMCRFAGEDGSIATVRLVFQH